MTSPVYLDAWTKTKDSFIAKNNLDDVQKAAVESKFQQYQASLEEYLTANAEDIRAHFAALDRLAARKVAGMNNAAHEKKRLWDEQMRSAASPAVGWPNWTAWAAKCAWLSGTF